MNVESAPKAVVDEVILLKLADRDGGKLIDSAPIHDGVNAADIPNEGVAAALGDLVAPEGGTYIADPLGADGVTVPEATAAANVDELHLVHRENDGETATDSPGFTGDLPSLRPAALAEELPLADEIPVSPSRVESPHEEVAAEVPVASEPVAAPAKRSQVHHAPRHRGYFGRRFHAAKESLKFNLKMMGLHTTKMVLIVGGIAGVAGGTIANGIQAHQADLAGNEQLKNLHLAGFAGIAGAAVLVHWLVKLTGRAMDRTYDQFSHHRN